MSAAACSHVSGIPYPVPSSSQTPRLAIAGAGFTLAAPIQREVAVLSNGTIYLAGGLDSASHSAAGVFSLQPSSGAMVRLGGVPDAFHDGAGALIEGNLVVFGGGSAEGSDVVQAFDLAGHTGAVVGHLPVILSDLSSATVGDMVYLVGGFDRVSPRREIYSTVDGVHFRVAATVSSHALRCSSIRSLRA